MPHKKTLNFIAIVYADWPPICHCAHGEDLVWLLHLLNPEDRDLEIKLPINDGTKGRAEHCEEVDPGRPLLPCLKCSSAKKMMML